MRSCKQERGLNSIHMDIAQGHDERPDLGLYEVTVK